jgi:ribonucleoside-triphosphate reductase
MRSERRDVAKAYIRYRFKHEAVRKSNNDFIIALSEKINAKDIENQNANVDEQSFGGRIGAASDL